MSGVCPMVALVLGPCIGGAALLTQLADVSIVAEKVGAADGVRPAGAWPP